MLASALRRLALRPRAVTALVVALVVGVCLAAVPAQAAGSGHITGVARTSNGVGLGGIQVTLYGDASGYWSSVATATTASDGAYDLSGLSDGTYRVGFSDPANGYAAEYWDDDSSLFAAHDIGLSGGATVSGIDAVMQRAGRITGRVTDPQGVGLGQITVQIYDDLDGRGWVSGRTVQTSADGTYVISGLLPADYLVEFSDASGAHVSEFYDDAAELYDARHVTVVAGSDTAKIDAQLAFASRVTGTVTGPGQTPVAGAQVTAYVDRGGFGNYEYLEYVMTDAAGHYELGGLGPGSYAVEFEDPQGRYLTEYYDNQPDLDSVDPVAVGDRVTVSGVDAQLAVAGRIAGTVTGVDGAPLDRIYADAYQKSGGEWVVKAYAQVRSDGSYQLGSLAAGTYRVGFGDGNRYYAPQFWNGKTSLAKAQDIAVTPGTVSGINAQLRRGSHIAGVVTAANGAALSGVEVNAFTYDRTYGFWRSVAQATTTSTGAYDIGGLAAGSYRIGFDDPSGQHLTEYWNDQATLERATDIKVGSQATASGKNAVLADAAHLTGVVTGADGTGLGGVPVEAYHTDPATGDVDGSSYTVTNADGTYDVGGLHAGTYRLQFQDTADHVGEYWNDKPTLAAADPITVAAGATVGGRNAQLAATSHITGTVTGPSGQALAGQWVYAYSVDPQSQDWELVSEGLTDSSGHYDVGRLSAGTYRLLFAGDDTYAKQYWKNKPTLESATGIKVGKEAVVAGKDARLVPAGHVTGVVTGRSGQPVSGADVVAYAYDSGSGRWTDVAGATTDATGRYDIGRLPANNYRIGFRDHGTQDSAVPRYAQQFWNGQPDVFSGQDVVVASGSTTSGISARLDRAATISGRVTTSSGVGVPSDVEVYRRTTSGSFELYTSSYTVNDHGAYTASGLPPGTYRLEFEPYDGYADEYYDDATTLATATDIVVSTVGQSIKGTNAVLSPSTAVSSVERGRDADPPVVGVRGDAEVGTTLVAEVEPTGSTPTDEPSRFQWSVGGVDVLGATGPTYTVRPQDVGQRVSVRPIGSGLDLDEHDGLVPTQAPALQAAGLRP